MGYVQKGNHLEFFIPNIPLATTTSGVLREIDIGAASASHGELICVRACVINTLGFMVVGEAASGTTSAPTVVFKKRPTPLSSSGESTIGTLTIPSGTAIGKVVYKKLSSPVTMAVGDSVEISWTVGVGTPTGMGFQFMICDNDPEVAGNNTDMIASA